MKETDHPFAKYVRILARGKTKSRPLTEVEAETAMSMIMSKEVYSEQLGAFLMLLRYKEETPEEIAGFVKAARSYIKPTNNDSEIDIDWSSYAGKQKQLPWYLLAALLLSANGFSILMHGTEGHTPGRIYTTDALNALGIRISKSYEEAYSNIKTSNFAYLPLESISPRLKELMELKTILGLRSPVHTIARLLNPFGAKCLLQGIFHRSFINTHQQAALLLNENQVAIFRGDSGEIEIRPNKPTDVYTVHNAKLGKHSWPAMLAESRQQIDTAMEISRLKKVWRGEDTDNYAISAIIGTVALALNLVGKSQGQKQSIKLAKNLWHRRDISYV